MTDNALLIPTLLELEARIVQDANTPENWGFMWQSFGDLIEKHHLPSVVQEGLLLVQYLGTKAPEREVNRLKEGIEIFQVDPTFGQGLTFEEYMRGDGREGLQSTILTSGDSICELLTLCFRSMNLEVREKIFDRIIEKGLYDLDPDLYADHQEKIEQGLESGMPSKCQHVRMLIFVWWERTVVGCLCPDKWIPA